MLKKGLLIMLLLVTVMVLSFAPTAFADSVANETQEIWENKQLNESTQLRLKNFAQKNESRQLRLQECEEPCDSACEPKQNSLQRNEQRNEQKELNRQQKHEVRKQLNGR